MICASNPILTQHKPPHCPEHPDRIECIWKDIDAVFGKDFITIINRKAQKQELLLAHDSSYIEYLFSLQGKKTYLDDETYISEKSIEVACIASGICIELIEQIIKGTYKKAFAFIRPPGHHAGKKFSMGYCIINNIAVAVAVALNSGYDKIAIFDIDAHHGNGTQNIFQQTNNVLCIDIHQENLFPKDSGSECDSGVQQGKGFTLNIPLPAQSFFNDYERVMSEKVFPKLQEFSPQLLCVSCGFDALYDDFEANMNLYPKDFGTITSIICNWADVLCKGKLLMVMEGGYYIEHVSQALQECLTVLKNWSVYD